MPVILRDLRERLADAAIAHPDNLASVWVTLSIGHSIRGAEDERPEALYARADARMYRAKRDGRNRVQG
jgi:diguanylate cyclase (GGDEF)-like protein